MVKKNKFLWKKEKDLLQRHEPCTKGKLIPKRKESYEFLDKEKAVISEFWGQNEVFFNPGSY